MPHHNCGQRVGTFARLVDEFPERRLGAVTLIGVLGASGSHVAFTSIGGRAAVIVAVIALVFGALAVAILQCQCGAALLRDGRWIPAAICALGSTLWFTSVVVLRVDPVVGRTLCVVGCLLLVPAVLTLPTARTRVVDSEYANVPLTGRRGHSAADTRSGGRFQ